MKQDGKLNRVMETKTSSKNGGSSKSLMSRIVTIIGIAMVSSCGTIGQYSYTSAQTYSLPVKTTEVITPLIIEGTNVPGTSLAEKLAWLQRSAESHNTYIVEVNTNENIAPHTLEYKGAVNITVVLRGDSINRTIRLKSNGTMFTILPNVTFILDNNITLQGHSGNTDVMVSVKGGIFKMNDGATIVGNDGGGVHVVYEPAYGNRMGTFEMHGGTISSNNTAYSGGGVNVGYRQKFIMSGGVISGNTADYGGGVAGGLTMTGGTISGNTAKKTGGGVSVNSGCSFEMTGGTISGNTANRGGGVNSDNKFTMRGGIITSNTALEYGGGVYGGITKTGGTITGYGSDTTNGNVVNDGAGILTRRGHAVCYIFSMANTMYRKENTVGQRENLSDRSENWDK